MLEIVPATCADHQGIAEIINSIYPENPTSKVEIREGDGQRDPKFKFQRWIAIEKNQVVGAGSFSQSIWFAHPQKFMLWIGVRPELQRGGIGCRLFETIMGGLRPFDPLAIRTSATGDLLMFLQANLSKQPFLNNALLIVLN